jgi:aldehyde dehydrogenase (NAD+)
MFIDGELTLASSGKTFENVNPATEEVIGLVADGDAGDMARAVGAARRAFDETSWSTDAALRKRALEQLASALRDERELFRAEVVAEVGCPVAITYGPQVDMPIDGSFDFNLRMIDEFPWERELPSVPGIGRALVTKQPVGVVGCIVPWNFPLEITLTKIAPILATGCTLVLKPAPDTPYSATRVARLVAEKTDIPAGVLNVVTSSDHLVGEAMVLDDRVDNISFTGSTATGKRIMATAAGSLKRLFLELGGKSANVVLDDAPFEEVLGAAAMVCVHAGQGCGMITRVLLPRSRYDEGLAIIEAAFAQVPYGDPTDPGNLMGPVVNAKQRERVLGYIDIGVEEGARLVCGGGTPDHLPKGYYVEPTLFADVDNSMRIAQEEIFGPVLSVIPYDDEDDAVRLANDSRYGLSGAVTAGDPAHALAVARRLRTGTVVAGGQFYRPDAPFGGYKQSGFGRQNGFEGFEMYLEAKAIGLPED